MAALCGKRAYGILFDFVLTMDAFNKVNDRLLEFFNANDDENIGSKYQALVNKTHP